jgi:HlyD family secretion protein
MNPDIYRKVALARLASPEQLDQLLRVTAPKSWVALIALLGLAGTAIVWGYEGRIATKTAGQGVIIRAGNVLNVATLGAGRVLEMRVAPGVHVRAEQVIGIVGQPEVAERIRITEAQIHDAEEHHGRISRVRADGVQLQLDSLGKQRAAVEKQVSDLNEQSKVVSDQIPVDEDLLVKGLVTRQQVLTDRQKLAQLETQIEGLRAQMTQITAQEYQSRNQGLQSDIEARSVVDDLRRELGALRKQLEMTTKVVSPYSGQVLEVKVIPGSLVAAGTTIISIQPDVKTLEAVVYISAAKVKEVQIGMEAEITPTTVKREEFGFIRARVAYIADYPATGAALMRVFENDALVHTLTSAGPVTEVRVSLAVDPSTVSGFQWSTGHGAPLTITSGTLCQVQIVTRHQRPISLVLPSVKEKLGLS